MDLETYVIENDIIQGAFAKKIGVSRPYLNRIINKKKYPSRKLAKKIEEETNGNVTAMELLFHK